MRPTVTSPIEPTLLKDAMMLRPADRASGLIGFATTLRLPTREPLPGIGLSAKDWLEMEIHPGEVTAVELVATSRVTPLRDFDQIAMQAGDLLRQVKFIAPYLADQHVLFVGDNDGASRLLGLLGERGYVPQPRRMTLLDFDERILDRTQQFAEKHGFADRLDTRLYNVFDAPPADLIGAVDWFYTNPPYGASNGGRSVRLFVLRGMEMCMPGAGRGCIIIPDADQQPWTEKVMATTQRTLLSAG